MEIFLQRCFYQSGQYSSNEDFKKLSEALSEVYIIPASVLLHAYISDIFDVIGLGPTKKGHLFCLIYVHQIAAQLVFTVAVLRFIVHTILKHCSCIFF